MGVGTNKLREAGTGRVIRYVRYGERPWRRNLYRHNGKLYKVTGNAWTGWYRSQIPHVEYKRLADWYRLQVEDEYHEHRAKYPWTKLPEDINQASIETIQDLFGAYRLPEAAQ